MLIFDIFEPWLLYYLVKTIRCNITKAFRIFVTLTESFQRNMGIIYKEDQEISPVYRRFIRSSICLMH